MSWPTPQDYNEAMQAPWLNLKDSALQTGKPALDFLGLPRPMTGAFASVYKLECGGRNYAIKLFLRNVADQQARYLELSEAVNGKELTNTVGFQYQPDGISIRGKNFPILRMDWADGDNLDRYVEEHLSEPQALDILLYHFRAMVKNLFRNGVAHGDLQHGNILVHNGYLKLVDYDGMYISRLKGWRSNELGHPNFQHPGRSGDHFGPYLDNFSAWAIQTSLIAVSVDPSVWGKLSGGDDCLLFRRADFENPSQSDAFKLLESHSSEAISTQAKLLRHLLKYPPEHVPALNEQITDVSQLPAIMGAEIIVKSRKSESSDGGSWAELTAGVSTIAAAAYSGAPATFVKGGVTPQISQPAQSGDSKQTFSGSQFPDWMQGIASQPQPGTQSPFSQSFSSQPPNAPFSSPLNSQAPVSVPAATPTPTPTPTPVPVPNREECTTGPWPRLEQYRAAISVPDLNFVDLELKTARLIPETKGLGANGYVFHMRTVNRHVAVKCFKEDVPDRQLRFDAVKKYVNGEARRYFIDFDYDPKGIRVGKFWYPTLKMEWLTPTLGEYINANMRNKTRLAALSERFHVMVQALHTLGIAHGDLEPDNIMVVNGDFKLIDYDGMYLPELEGLSGIELGHPAFQHPARQTHHFGPRLDYFSAWILDAELAYLKVDPTLWAQAEIRSQAAVAKTSRATSDSSFLDMHPSKSVRHTGDVWRKLIDYDLDSIPKFDPRSPIFTMRTT